MMLICSTEKWNLVRVKWVPNYFVLVAILLFFLFLWLLWLLFSKIAKDIHPLLNLSQGQGTLRRTEEVIQRPVSHVHRSTQRMDNVGVMKVSFPPVTPGKSKCMNKTKQKAGLPCRHHVVENGCTHGLTFTWRGCYGLSIWHKPTELAHSFFILFLYLFVFIALSTVFHFINSPDNSPFSHSVLPVLSLPYWSFSQYVSLRKTPSALM